MKLSKNLYKTLFFTFTLIVGGILFIAIIEEVGVKNIIQTILTFRLKHFIILVLLGLINSLISTLRWKIILDATGNITTFKSAYIARMVGASINYLTPSGLVLGEPFKAMVLSGKTGLSLGSTMASIIIEGSIFLSTFILFITIGIFAFLSYSAVSLKTTAIVAAALFFLIGLFYLFFTKMVKTSGTKGEKGFFSYIIDLLHLNRFSIINNLKSQIIFRENQIKNFFQLHKKVVYYAVLLSILEMILTVAISWFTLYFIGLTVGLKALLGLFSLMSISYLIPLPASLGGLELSQIFAFNFFGLGGEATALAFALITRLVTLVFVAMGIGFLIQYELDMISKKITNFIIGIKQKIRGLFQSL